MLEAKQRAALVQRVYLYDVLACPCGGARTTLADVCLTSITNSP